MIDKVILPNARAYTRLRGSNHSGKEFITGDTRVAFQDDFQKTMKSTCDKQGIEVIQALITTSSRRTRSPIRSAGGRSPCSRKISTRRKSNSRRPSRNWPCKRPRSSRRKELVAASQEVVVVTTEAKKKQEVALIDANKRLAVAEQKLLAAKDLAAAIMAKGKADADVIEFANQAEAAGWQKSIAAFGGNGNEFARWTLYKKLAPAFRSMMINTDNSPLMDVFKAFDSKPAARRPPPMPPRRPRH